MASQEVIDLWEDYQADWRLFAREHLQVDLDQEQEEALSAIQFNSKVAISSGTSRGKDYLMAVAALCFMYLTPEFDETGKMVGNTKCILTGPTGRQVEKIIMPEISRVFRNSISLPGVLTGHDIKTPFEEWYLTAFKADDKNTEAWTGFHAVNMFFGVTEATGIAQEVFNAIEGNLQGNSRLVLVFNPNITTGYAADAMRSPEFKKIRLNSLNAPNVIQKKTIFPGQVDYQWVADRVRLWCEMIDQSQASAIEGDFEFEGSWYRPNDLFRIKILGLFPKVDEDVLIPMEWIELANKRWKDFNQKKKPIESQLRLGVDVAGMGRDKSCFAYRYGNYVAKFEMKDGKGTANHMEIVGIVKTILMTNTDQYRGKYPQAFIDTIGEGAGVFSRLQEIRREEILSTDKDNRIMQSHSVKFSEAAKAGKAPLKDATGQREFLNMRAYLFWAVRDWLDPAKKKDQDLAMMPPDDEFAQEATAIRWMTRSNGQIQIEDKEEIIKRLKRSTDKFDALANTFYPQKDINGRSSGQLKNVADYFF